MHLNSDISSALQLLNNIKQVIDEIDDPKLQTNTNEHLELLISTLENPVFRGIVTVQDSVSELSQELIQHPSILPVDFDITSSGELVLNVPSSVELYDPYRVSTHGNLDTSQTGLDDEQRVPSAQLSPGSPQPLSFNQTPCHTMDLSSLIPRENMSHQTINILQKNRGLVELVVARGAGVSTSLEDEEGVQRSPSAVSDASKAGSDVLLTTEWAQVEAIELINDGTGLGFGIIGGRTMGVVVKTILPGGVADRDGRLRSGDHILQIGEVNLHEMGSEQVATVLRQSGTRVRLVVARMAEPPHPHLLSSSHTPIVPTRLLSNPVDLDCYLLQHGYPEIFNKSYHYDCTTSVVPSLPIVPGSPSLPLLNLELKNIPLPEMEKFTIELKKDANGLGITIAGYVCEKEELSGIFVKSISAGSAADLSGQIQVNDRIVAVDGKSLHGHTNHEAVEVLRASGSTVTLCLERYLRGPKYEQLQQAIAANELTPSTPATPQSQQRVKRKGTEDEELSTNEKPIEATNTHAGTHLAIIDAPKKRSIDPQKPLTPAEEAALISKWNAIVGSDTEIVIAELRKFGEGGGLGISLEGTVDVEDGREVRPHHYIRSILPEGPVGRDGRLCSGDELLEVNGVRLLGMNHMEVVSILKELPVNVRMVCGRSPRPVSAVQNRNTLSGSLQDLLPASDRLVKAKSDGSLATSASVTDTNGLLCKMRSRSLEPLTGLAMWSSEPQVIELIKGERGLGFSILDYQDPIDPNDTVIVIRSLVPGGVAQLDGRLIPGDRLLFVNDTVLENASLDQAVQALKGAPRGVVRIGVAKPLPVPDTLTHANHIPSSISPGANSAS